MPLHKNLGRNFICEFIGTCFYTFLSCGTYIFSSNQYGKITDNNSIIIGSVGNGFAYGIVRD